MIDILEEELVRKGKMTKSPFDMTFEKEWQIQKQIEARHSCFLLGRRLFIKKMK